MKMKKVFMLYLLVIVTFTSCKKTYTYVEVVNRTDILGSNGIALKEEETIRSRSDTSAYLEAYKRFCISLKAYSIMEEQGASKYLDKPLDFRLLNSNQEDISNISFQTKSDEENRISKQIFSINVNGTDSFSKKKKTVSKKRIQIERILFAIKANITNITLILYLTTPITPKSSKKLSPILI